MGEASRVVIKPWLLPVIIVAIVVPSAAAFVIGGPGVGLAAGALTAACLVVVAARKNPDEPIEVAGSHDGRRRLLLLATEPVDRPDEVESMKAAAAAGPAAGSEVLVVAPALDSPLERWASDVRRSRLDAQRKLVLTLGALAAARVEARGAVGDPDPLQAVEDTLRDYPADEVIVAGADRSVPQTRRLVDELRRRLDLPVYRLN